MLAAASISQCPVTSGHDAAQTQIHEGDKCRKRYGRHKAVNDEVSPVSVSLAGGVSNWIPRRPFPPRFDEASCYKRLWFAMRPAWAVGSRPQTVSATSAIDPKPPLPRLESGHTMPSSTRTVSFSLGAWICTEAGA